MSDRSILSRSERSKSLTTSCLRRPRPGVARAEDELVGTAATDHRIARAPAGDLVAALAALERVAARAAAQRIIAAADGATGDLNHFGGRLREVHRENGFSPVWKLSFSAVFSAVMEIVGIFDSPLGYGRPLAAAAEPVRKRSDGREPCRDLARRGVAPDRGRDMSGGSSGAGGMARGEIRDEAGGGRWQCNRPPG